MVSAAQYHARPVTGAPRPRQASCGLILPAGMPRWPEGQGSRPAGLRCTQRLRADRSRSCAAARTKVRGWHQEHPQSPWAPVLPHTFKRRRKFENSQPPSSFLLLSRLPPRLTHLGCSLLPSPPLLLLPPTRHSLEDRPIAASPDALIVGLAQQCGLWDIRADRGPPEASSSQRVAEEGSEERESTARLHLSTTTTTRHHRSQRRQTGCITPHRPNTHSSHRPRDHRCRRCSNT